MPSEFTLIMAFMAGILGSGHCIGMCGGLVCAIFVTLGEQARRPLNYAVYHGARLLVYATFGLIAGTLGLALTSTGIIGKAQGLLQIAAGVVMIALGLDLLAIGPWRFGLNTLPTGILRPALARARQQGPTAGAMVGGIINGLMPCALTLAMAVKATTAGGALAGAAIMIAFGLGTLPSMLLVSALAGRVSFQQRGKLLQLAALVVIALGIFTAWQGAMFFDAIKGLSNW